MISDILPEVLCRIFLFLAAVSPYSPTPCYSDFVFGCRCVRMAAGHRHFQDPEEYRLHTLDNFAFSHVCRYWREVALAEPLLWSRIHLFSPSPECAREMFVRAKGSPLVIELCPPPVVLCQDDVVVNLTSAAQQLTSEKKTRGHEWDAVSWAFKNLDRVGELFISDWGWHSAKRLPSRDDDIGDLSNLKRLRIVLAGSLWSSPPLHNTFLEIIARKATALQALELENCRRWDWTSGIFTNLRHLAMEISETSVRQQLEQTEKQNFSDLLHALGRCPALETLRLIESIPPPCKEARHVPQPVTRSRFPPPPGHVAGARGAQDNLYNNNSPPTTEPVPLSHLRRLELKSSAFRMAELVRALRIPDSTCCSYHVSNQGYAELEKTEHTRSCLSLLSPWEGRLKSISLCTSASQDSLAGSTREGGEPALLFQNQEPSMGWRENHADHARVFRAVTSVSFSWAGSALFAAQAIQNLTDSVPTMTSLRIEPNSDGLEFIKAYLKMDARTLQNLRDLEICSLSTQDLNTSLALMDALKTRKVRGHKLAVLRIPSGVMSPEYVKRLRTVVGIVEAAE